MLVKETTARFIEPMLLQRIQSLPEGPNWAYEVKLDGYRVLATKPARKSFDWSLWFDTSIDTASRNANLPARPSGTYPCASDHKRIALAEIIVGPNQNAETARERLKELLRQNGYVSGSLEYPAINL